jgi:hypothetical protein
LLFGNLFPPTTRLYGTEKSFIDPYFPAAADPIPLSTHLSRKTPALSAIHPSLPESQKGAAKNGVFFAQTALNTHPCCKTLPRHSKRAWLLQHSTLPVQKTREFVSDHRAGFSTLDGLPSFTLYSLFSFPSALHPIFCLSLCTLHFLLRTQYSARSLWQRHAPSHPPKMRHSPKRRHFPIFPPFVSQLGGAPRPSRRQCLSEVIVLAALPVFPGAHFGGKFHSALRGVFTHPLF